MAVVQQGRSTFRKVGWIGASGLLAISMVLVSLRVGGAAAFEMRSAAFEASEAIPRKHTCDGADVSPELSWHEPPEGTRSLALVCDDPDAPAGVWVHWVMYDIPAATTKLPEAVQRKEKLGDGSAQGVNDFRKIGYGGPCPPPGRPHRYRFHLYALDRFTKLPPRATRAQLVEAIEGHILGTAELVGTYGR